jgi:uncharacterized membrane protein
MTKTIGNPLSWTADAVIGTFEAIGGLFRGVATHGDAALPEVRRLTTADLRDALRKGAEDMGTFRSDVVFACLLYPVMGAALAAVALRGDLVQLVFPLLSGFALIGPVAALGLYEMSRRREQGEEVGWSALFDVLKSPRLGGIIVLALIHLVVFMAWVTIANLIYGATLDLEPPVSTGEFVAAVFGSAAGWAMIGIGCAVGFLFAALVLAMSVVSFPLLLDRDVGVAGAIVTSLRVAAASPGPVAAWGLAVAVLLALGTLPFLLGLMLVMPLLGHATWHLYRHAVA